MVLLRQRTGPFHRIGDRYNTFFGSSDHFMGRSAFDDNWLSRNSHPYGDNVENEPQTVKPKAKKA